MGADLNDDELIIVGLSHIDDGTVPGPMRVVSLSRA